MTNLSWRNVGLIVIIICMALTPVVLGYSQYTVHDQFDSQSEFNTERGTQVNSEVGEFAHNDSESTTYVPDRGIPNNQFRNFYSGDKDKNIGDVSDVNVTSPDDDGDLENSSLSNVIGNSERKSRLVSGNARTSDEIFFVTPNAQTYSGWTMWEYRHNQLLEPNQSSTQSHVIDGNSVISDGVISNHYTDIVGIQGGSMPHFQFPENYSYTIGDTGAVLVYNDFLIDYKQMPADRRDPLVSHTGYQDKAKYTGGAYTGDKIDISPYYTEPTKQTQTGYGNNVQNFTISHQLIADGSNTSYIVGNKTIKSNSPIVYNESYRKVRNAHINRSASANFIYNDTVNEEIEFEAFSGIELNRSQYEWNRTRYKVYDQNNTEVTASTTTSGSASCYGSAPENSTSISCSCSTTSSEDDVSTTESRSWTELDGDRNIGITRTKKIDISGTISGTCSGTASTEGGSGTVSSTISGTITGSATVTFYYEYWDWWNPADDTDKGGWNLRNKTFTQSDSALSGDKTLTRNIERNEINVSQVVLEITDNRYHSIVDIDYEHKPGSVAKSEMDDQYYWSGIIFGENQFVASNWKSFSKSRYDSDVVTTASTSSSDERSESAFVGNRKGMPPQVGVWTYNQNSTPNLVGPGSPVGERSPKLSGWSANESTGLQDVNGVPEKCGVSTSSTSSTSSSSSYNYYYSGTTSSSSSSTSSLSQFKKHAEYPLCKSGNNIQVDVAKPIFYDKLVVENMNEPATGVVSIHGGVKEIPESSITYMEYVKPDVDIEFNGNTSEITVTDPDTGQPLTGRTIQVQTRTGNASGQYTTNGNGKVTMNISQGLNYMQTYVQGDDISKLVEESENASTARFYGSARAKKSGMGTQPRTVVERGAALIFQLLLATPLLLIYLLWRDARIGA